MWDSPPERIVALMDRAGIDRAVIMPYGEIHPTDPSLLEETIAACQAFPERLIAFARMHPAGGAAGIALFERSVRSGAVKGLKFHPVGSMTHPVDPGHIAFTEKAAELGVPVLFHCGDEEWTLPHQIGRLARQVPEAKIILGHMGGYFHVEDAIRVAEEHPNCFLETSATPDPRLIERAVERLGAERLIFGSDGPGCLPALELAKIRLLGLGPELEEKLLSGTMLGLLPEEAR